MNKKGSHTEIRRFLGPAEAIAAGAFNVHTKSLPADPWGTSVSLIMGTVRVRNSDGKVIV